MLNAIWKGELQKGLTGLQVLSCGPCQMEFQNTCLNDFSLSKTQPSAQSIVLNWAYGKKTLKGAPWPGDYGRSIIPILYNKGCQNISWLCPDHQQSARPFRGSHAPGLLILWVCSCLIGSVSSHTWLCSFTACLQPLSHPLPSEQQLLPSSFPNPSNQHLQHPGWKWGIREWKDLSKAKPEI